MATETWHVLTLGLLTLDVRAFVFAWRILMLGVGGWVMVGDLGRGCDAGGKKEKDLLEVRGDERG